MTYEQRGAEIGKVVETKQKAYGNAVDVSVDAMKAFLKPYRTENNTYTIPEELLVHLLLQIRIIDKQCRIFNNPKADLMGESPYTDIAGYALLGEAIQRGK